MLKKNKAQEKISKEYTALLESKRLEKSELAKTNLKHLKSEQKEKCD